VTKSNSNSLPKKPKGVNKVNPGNNPIASITYQNQVVNLIVSAQSDPPETIYGIQFIRGDYTVASPIVVAQTVIDYIQGQTETEDPDIQTFVQLAILSFNS
jgi:hypothetical protein